MASFPAGIVGKNPKLIIKIVQSSHGKIFRQLAANSGDHAEAASKHPPFPFLPLLLGNIEQRKTI